MTAAPVFFRGLLRAIVALTVVLVAAAPAFAQQDIFENCGPEFSALTHVGPKLGGVAAGSVTIEVHIKCGDLSIFADSVSWNEKTATASGRLLVVQKGFRITAARAEFDRQTRLGVFHEAAGTAVISQSAGEPSMFGSLEPELVFKAETLEKTGPRTYKITNGWFSTCVQPNPRWAINGSSGTITLDERVILKNSVLRVKGVPVIYIPFIYYPLGEDDRATGLLTPTYSTSSYRGQGWSNAFFWAIDRSQDATFYHDYFSKAGHGLGAEYRFVPAPGSRGEVSFYMLNDRARFNPDGSLIRAASRSYRLEGNVNQQLPGRAQVIARVNYFTDSVTQQLYQQNVYDFSRRDREFTGTLTKDWYVDRTSLRFKGHYSRREAFSGLSNAQLQERLPELRFDLSDRALDTDTPGSFLSRVYVSGNSEFINFRNRLDFNDSQTERNVWRLDGAPAIRATLTTQQFLTLTTSAAWRLTRWSDSIDPLTGDPASVALNRSLLDLRADMAGPILQRTSQEKTTGWLRQYRHRIEPRVSLQWLSPFEHFNEVLRNDYTDHQVGGTTSINYSLTNTLIGKVAQKSGEPTRRELLSVTVSQRYYSNALASQFDIDYQGASQGSFSPVRVRASTSPRDRTDATFEMYIDSKTMAIQSYSASASVFTELAEVTGGWAKRQFLPDVPGFDNPALATHFLNGSVRLTTSSKRFGGRYEFNYDVRNGGFLNQRVIAFMSAQCCGVSFDYQTFDLGHLSLTGLQQDRRFGISFTLAGIGSFSNPMGAFGSNMGRR